MKRRWLLLPPVGAVGLIFPTLRNFYYISFLSILSIFILLSVFPFLVEMLHTEPTYVKDLDCLSGPDIDPVTTMKYRRMFVVIMKVMLAIAVCGITNYIIFDVQTHNYSMVQVIGTVGGCGAGYKKVHELGGKALLYLLKWRKKSLHARTVKITGPKTEENVAPDSLPELENVAPDSIPQILIMQEVESVTLNV
jgi:hypothetical protein